MAATSARGACPELHQVLGAQLHQDFDLDHETVERALISSVADAGDERLRRAAAELRTHRPPRGDEQATRRFVNDLCDYHPPGDGVTYVAWLDHVQAVLDGTISTQPPLVARRGQSVRLDDLQRLLAEHLATPFPSGVIKGCDYGSVDPVMIAADIYGWASRVSEGEALASVDRDRLGRARDNLAESLAAFPETARPYYKQLVRIATAALS